ncbi:MAG TPA: pyruvate kinase [Methylomusa anaerophila]|uniref:Pyruvate kinase n=1 Tax=Methylomusa anaerophila TaxID=1930071 RepID=A0A348AER2_9FIRM|nr:pyruvate kinase [Methylomusa anaerophila]BBB89560.1 pyruvate kinase [Methylomusa anaerophila]HML90072.1 pyruvate kinase [Methylomusa anaerophila]
MTRPYIIATIGTGATDKNKINNILLNGADILRYNLGRSNDFDNFDNKLEVAKDVISNYNSKKILIDIPFPAQKVRFGEFRTPTLCVSSGDIKIIKSSSCSFEFSDDCLQTNYCKLGNFVNNNQIITVGDGQVAFEVLKIVDEYTIVVKFINSGYIKKYSSVNCEVIMNEKYDEYSQILNKWKPDCIAFSFVESASQLTDCTYKLKLNRTWRPLIISKIETQLGIDNADQISQVSDALIMARGDLGVRTPITKLGINQKKLTRIVKNNHKGIIISTQIIESLSKSYIPQRSDVLDLTNMLLDNVDGIMLCDETSRNPTPERVLKFIKEVIEIMQYEGGDLY